MVLPLVALIFNNLKMFFNHFIMILSNLQKKTMNFQFKLIIIYIFINVIPTIFMFIIIYSNWSYMEEKGAIVFSEKIINQIGRNMEYNFHSAFNFYQYIYNNPIIIDFLNKEEGQYNYQDARNAREEFRRLSSDMCNYRYDVNSIFFSCMNGERFLESSDQTYVVSEKDYMKEAWYKDTLKANGSPVVIPTHRLYQDNSKLVFSFSKLIKDVNSFQPLAVLLVNYELNSIESICSNLNYDEESKIIVIDDGGGIIYHTNETEIMKNIDKDMFAIMSGHKAGNFSWVDEGEDSIFVFSTINPYNWKVISVIPRSKLMRRMVKSEDMIILVSVLSLFFIVTASMTLLNRVANPLRKLAFLMQRSVENNFNIRAEINTHDEIGQLSISYNQMMDTIKQLIQNEYESKIQMREAELMSLFAQINPHFLYNTLEIINSKAQIEDQKEISTMVKALGDMFRYNIESVDAVVPIRSEIENVTNYMKIQQVRLRSQLVFNVYGLEQNILNCRIPKLSLQPLIENCITHGMSDKVEVLKIDLKFSIINNTLSVEVIDNGDGISPVRMEQINKLLNSKAELVWDEQRKKRGIGLYNVHKRIRLLFGEQYGLKILNADLPGVHIQLLLPLVVEL